MRLLVRGLGALLLAVLVAYMAFHLGASWHRSNDATVDVGVTTTPIKQHAAPSPSPAVVSTTPAPDWEATARTFAAAFLDHSRTREARIRPIVTPRLATLLARTDPAKIPDERPVGNPRVVAQTAETVTVTQQLSDDSAIAFDLVPDPTCPEGWVVTSVRPGSR